MLYRLRNSTARTLFDYSCRRILDTPPLVFRDAPLVICSMLCRRDLIMYLLAIKSLYSQLGEGRICVINDGSLDQHCIQILQHHLTQLEITHIDQIPTDSCPSGGTWERLLHVLDLSSSDYVIQIDSDVLVRGPIPEVLSHYRENRSFTLGTPTGNALKTVYESAEFAKGKSSKNVQISAEIALAQLPDVHERHYVRGCSAFTGFARGATKRSDAIQFSQNMQTLLGHKWTEWGSEQVTSNYLIANAPKSAILPTNTYVNFLPPFNVQESALIHFLGEYRFRHATYRNEARKQITRMLR